MSRSELHPCPETEASSLSRFFFMWSNGLVKKGEDGSLTGDGLWDINPAEKCRNSCSVFYKALIHAQKSHFSQSDSYNAVSSDAVTTNLPHNHLSNDNVRHRRKEGSKVEHGFQPLDKNTLLLERKGGISTKGTRHRPLWFIIIKTFWREYLQTLGLRFLQDSAFWITNPYFMSYMMDHASDPNSSMLVGVILSLTLLLLLMMGNLFSEHSKWKNQKLQMHIRSSLMTSVYKKAMNIHSKSRKNYSMGEITNYLSSDCDTITYHITHANFVMFTPVNFIVVFYHLFQILGSAAWLGLLAIILITPVNIYIMVKMRSLYEQYYKLKDEKMKLLNEVLTGIKALKLYAWEKCFGDKLDRARNKELEVLNHILSWRTFTVFSWTSSPYVISAVMFGGYFFMNEGIILTAKSAFAVVSLMNMLRFAINQGPEILYDIIKVDVSTKRLEKFLYEDEFKLESVGKICNDNMAIELKDASFRWDMESNITLKSIDLSIPKGSLVAVVGQVGSGKSSLLSAILGDIEKISGHQGKEGSIAYVSQQAWVQNNTLKDNIRFGKSMDRNLYKKVIYACALKPDLDMLPAGDLTEIGERGINLSGGQKQRVSLARAVYNDADIYLLDDPLSAVDSHVGNHIFDKVISDRGMLRNKTRLLVTHNVRYLPEVDNIIVLQWGKVVEKGSFMELLNSDGVFTSVLQSYMAEYEDNRTCLEELQSKMDEVTRCKLNWFDNSKGVSVNDDNCDNGQTSNTISRQLSRQLSESENILKQDVKCIQEEKRREINGKEKWNLFLKYSKAFDIRYMWAICVMYGLYYFLWVGANIWLVKWTEDPFLKNVSDDTLHNVTTAKAIWRTNMKYLSVYCGLGVLMTACILAYAISMKLGMIMASRRLHHDMLKAILKSPVEFFDTTPLGRITTRFSNDIYVVDDELPYILEFWFDSFMNITVTVLAVVYSTPSVLALIIPLAYYYWDLQKPHTQRSNVMCDLEAKTRSPIESHFTESVTGADIVRAYRAQERFFEKLEDKIDEYHRMKFYSALNQRLLGVHIMGVSNLVCAVSSLIRGVFKGAQSAGLIGLGTTFSMEVAGSMGWLVILQSRVETNIISIDRIMKYTNNTNEAKWRNNSVLLQPLWPEKGKLEFRSYSLRYRLGLDLVLKNISFSVEGGEKIGVVGRTGAGKSSLMLSLFRLVEPAEGTVLIDGVDITDIGLHDLREKLAIIPQDPVLFTGSLRMNLDPQDLYTDEDIWTALDHTHLRQFVESLPDRLQSVCGEGGRNFSVGQRQLFCLTRTLLRKAKILVLDEATAAVDMETDDMIQKTIRSEFVDCTVLTIAHRLNTVMDYDRILVLDQGEVIELESPSRLLQRKGVFHQMVVNAGLIAADNDAFKRLG